MKNETDEQKLAREAAEKIAATHRSFGYHFDVEQIILAAIEKAKEPDANAIDAAIREALAFHPWTYDKLYTRLVRVMYGQPAERQPPAQPQSSEGIDPVTGYRYDQEIPKPICDMQQITAVATSGQKQWTPEWLHASGIFTTEQMCAAHNAAMAAEREHRKLVDAVLDNRMLQIRELERITSATGREAKLEQQLLAAEAALKKLQDKQK